MGEVVLPSFKLNLKRFRSLRNDCVIPFRSNFTFLVGQNNSGKSNILRGLAAFFNKEYNVGENDSEFRLEIAKDRLEFFFASYPHLKRAVSEYKLKHVSITITAKDNGIQVQFDNAFRDYLRDNYIILGNRFREDFNTSSSQESNIAKITNLIHESIRVEQVGSIYVPTNRYIPIPGFGHQKFSNFIMPGQTLDQSNIVEKLSTMDRPSTDNYDIFKRDFDGIQRFLCYCLEAKSAELQVSSDRKTIHVIINGERRTLQDLGTGVEQLIIIGLASFGFNNRIVLIDEPELHFHPRTQRRMIKYLSDNVDATFVFATHSAAILDSLDADILQVTHDGKASNVRTIENNSDRYEAVRDLGYSPSDIVQTRFAIWVEGPSDRIYLNYWLGQTAPDLVEGVDYSILFYGGKILSHHSFVEDDNDFLKALSFSRSFAVIMDSDRHARKAHLNSTKRRIHDEVIRSKGICWITDGREIENYIPHATLIALADKFDWVKLPIHKTDQILDPARAKKTEFAKEAIKSFGENWPLDLRKRVDELVMKIRLAKNL